SNAERATSNSERKRHFEIGCSALRVRRLLSSVRRSTSLLLERILGDVPPRHEDQRAFRKNVTIFSLPWLFGLLHIVYPTGQPRYYLLLTDIHRLLAPLFTSIRILFGN